MNEPRFLYRSAVTGRFVKAAYAKRYPHRTIREKFRPAREPYLKPVYANPETEH